MLEFIVYFFVNIVFHTVGAGLRYLLSNKKKKFNEFLGTEEEAINALFGIGFIVLLIFTIIVFVKKI